MGGRVIAAAAASLLVLLSAAAAARAAGTLTYPADGQTVTLDANSNLTYHWTLPPGETHPTVRRRFARRRRGSLLAVAGRCSGDSDTATSCRGEGTLNAGTHYAFLFSSNADNTENYTSPVIRCVAPLLFRLGCAPFHEPGPDCDPGVQASTFRPYRPGQRASSAVLVVGWVNSPGILVKTTFTIRNGKRVVKRGRASYHADRNFEFNSDFTLYHHRGLRHGRRLRCDVNISVPGATIKRRVALKAPVGRAAALVNNATPTTDAGSGVYASAGPSGSPRFAQANAPRPRGRCLTASSGCHRLPSRPS